MININGKEWDKVSAEDIRAIVDSYDKDESFFFEFKDDRVSTKKLSEEISAFSNTFGGYIFVGVTDDKKIAGCSEWNEQRIHTTIHDSLTPVPIFDIKKVTFETGHVVYIIRVEQGTEPPYITNQGKIYERISSGSFPVKDSVRLSQIYNRREQQIEKIEKKLYIPPFVDRISNVFGCIDIGFALYTSDVDRATDVFEKANINDLMQKPVVDISTANAFRVGESILYTPGALSTPAKHMPAHANNFIEIMADGSAKMRVLLTNNDVEQTTVNFVLTNTFLNAFKRIYTAIMDELFPQEFVYAKKYEALTTLSQFSPEFYYEDYMIEMHPELAQENERLLNQNRYVSSEARMVVTNDRIPKTGLYTVDKRSMERWGCEYTGESIIDMLFYSSFSRMGINAE